MEGGRCLFCVVMGGSFIDLGDITFDDRGDGFGSCPKLKKSVPGVSSFNPPIVLSSSNKLLSDWGISFISSLRIVLE